MERRQPPQTDEGWYVLHDFRSVDWDAWRDAPERRRRRAVDEGIDYLTACEGLEDADDGDSATFSVLGHEADLLVVHLRPSLAEIDALERRFERSAFAAFTERTDSYVSVTEASGYTAAQDYFDPDAEADPGIRNYIDRRLYPDIPDAEYVSFYPMDKRRDPEYNWYDLPFDDRAEHMSGHGDIGREYAGRVVQIVSGSVGLDDHEWGVTLFADDPTDIKALLYEMRFDPSSSRYAEFGRFYVGRRLAPAHLEAFVAGEPVPDGADATDEDDGRAPAGEDADREGRQRGHDPSAGRAGGPPADDEGDESVRTELQDLGVYEGQPHGEDVHAVVVYSAADPGELFDEVEGLRSNFDHYDTHVKTAVYVPEFGDGAEAAVVSLWETERAANTAAGFLADLPEVVRQAGDNDDSWGTMGMFYTVKPEHREAFVDTFADVGGLLAEMDGHRGSDLLVNREDELDMFIASRWDAREDAMGFFRSDEFAETVEWGRDVLDDRPRHVFLA